MKRKLSAVLALIMAVTCFTGCQKSEPSPGDKEGYDSGEEYLSIWVHTIEDTDEGRCYKESVQKFNEVYNGKYFADIEFIPRNDSGGGYSDKINASVMSVRTLRHMRQTTLFSRLHSLRMKNEASILNQLLIKVHMTVSCMHSAQWSRALDSTTTNKFLKRQA